MSTKQDIINKVDAYFREPYEIDKTTIVPGTDYSKLTFGNKGLVSELAFLFVDIRGSSKLHETYGYENAAKIYQAFHDINVRIINMMSGQVRAFDGDRIMGVFAGVAKRTNAVKAAMHIRWAVKDVLNPKLSPPLKIGAGVDFGQTLVTKVGKGRDVNNNDLVWVGPACNMASHLSSLGNDTILITEQTYVGMLETNKISNGKPMWEKVAVTLKNSERIWCYRSNWTWMVQ